VKNLACVALAALLGCTAAHAYPERPDQPVLDLADILPSTHEAALDQRLTTLWNTTGNALIVVSVNSLEGRSIEDYATGLFNEWGIGDAKTDRGLLVLVAPTERKVRIEVGCGLEGRITNEVAATIIRDAMIPRYKAGDLEGGTQSGVDALVAKLNAPATANDNVRTTPFCKNKAKAAA
jgi:uncharacterized protein